MLVCAYACEIPLNLQPSGCSSDLGGGEEQPGCNRLHQSIRSLVFSRSLPHSVSSLVFMLALLTQKPALLQQSHQSSADCVWRVVLFSGEGKPRARILSFLTVPRIVIRIRYSRN
ncbi:MAG: hypothetical protein C5B58_03685 [Acidobacteria bacterium]|nr:MAG: hypothetical protein C5B58_03685 [Acidobacteriota bacterium]